MEGMTMLDANNNHRSPVGSITGSMSGIGVASVTPLMLSSSSLTPDTTVVVGVPAGGNDPVHSTVDDTFSVHFNAPTSSHSQPQSGTFDCNTSKTHFDFIDSSAGPMKMSTLSCDAHPLHHATMPPNNLWNKPWTQYQNCGPESNDSSYDSDQDSNQNSCSDLKQFVIDLVDSGNSTTPEDENHNSSFASEIAPLDAFNEHRPSLGTAVHRQHHHEEINRTNSETLGQEYREYVTRLMLPGRTENSNFAGSSVSTVISDSVVSGGIDETSEDENDDQFDVAWLNVAANQSAYEANLKYALKLGYSKRHLQRTIVRLGFGVEKNELLEELIRISDLDATSLKGAAKLTRSGRDFNPIQRTLSNRGSNSALGGSLRPIVIDGSNVAISHGNREFFSCKGIAIVVQWFRARGHTEITVFVPLWRTQHSFKHAIPIRDREILEILANERVVMFTPSRSESGRLVACHDDRYILNLAVKNQGIVVSNDNFRDLSAESEDYAKLVKDRLLMFTFVNDEFMPPDDPLGRNGPRLDVFLRFASSGDAKYQQLCPYDKKCTYGIKCKYLHPERDPMASHKSLAEQMSENAKRSWSRGKTPLKSMNSLPLHLHSSSFESCDANINAKKSLCRTKSILVDIPLTSAPKTLCSTLTPKPSVAPCPMGERKHRKLERQLTLNPGADPRLAQLQMPRNCGAQSLKVPVANNKQKLALTKSCGNGAFNSFDLANMLSVGHIGQSKPNRQFSHSTRNLTESSSAGLNLLQQQQRMSYIHHPHPQQQHSHPNILVKSLSLSSPCHQSLNTYSNSHSHSHSNSNSNSNNSHKVPTTLSEFSLISQMPSVTITAETPVTEFGDSHSNQSQGLGSGGAQFNLFSRSKAPLQQSHSFSAISNVNCAIPNSMRCTTANSSQSQLFSYTSQHHQHHNHHHPSQPASLAFSSPYSPSSSSQSLPPIVVSANVRKNSGVCLGDRSTTAIAPIHQTVSRNLSAPEASNQHPPQAPQLQQPQPVHFVRQQAPTSTSHQRLTTTHLSSSMASHCTTMSAVNLPGLASTGASLDWPVSSSSHTGHFHSNSGETIDEQRSKIFYHLSSIFTANQVSRAMESLDPRETNPQVICAQILRQEQTLRAAEVNIANRNNVSETSSNI